MMVFGLSVVSSGCTLGVATTVPEVRNLPADVGIITNTMFPCSSYRESIHSLEGLSDCTAVPDGEGAVSASQQLVTARTLSSTPKSQGRSNHVIGTQQTGNHHAEPWSQRPATKIQRP